MDEIDRNLIDAWDRITATCRRDRREAAKRARRQWSATLTRPPRAWCVAIRAADSRLTEQFGVFAREDEVEMRIAHDVLIDGAAIRRLCEPVWIKWPGVPLDEAAVLLGRHRESLRKWLPVRPGRTKAARDRNAPETWREIRDPNFPLNVRYERAVTLGRRGCDVPVVWTNSPLDPAADQGATPHAVWGSMWQRLGSRIGDDYLINVRREPDFRDYKDGYRFRGWQWRCPGRWLPIESFDDEQRRTLDAWSEDEATDTDSVIMTDGDGRTFGRWPCGKLCRKLYGPLPVYTIAHLVGGEGLEVGESGESGEPRAAGDGAGGLRLSGDWLPGLSDPLAGLRSLACEWCWNLRWFSFTDATWWNEFVSYISGGLLYGHEVAKPCDVAFERKYAFKKRVVSAKPRTAKSARPQATRSGDKGFACYRR